MSVETPFKAQASSLELAALPDAVGLARLHTASTLHQWSLPDDLIETAVLLVSEIATNAVVHGQAEDLAPPCPHVALMGAGRFWLRLHRNQARLLVEVRDTDNRPPVLQRAAEGAESGHGLMLVQALSSTWGYYYSGACKIVWFEIWLTLPRLPLLRRAWPPPDRWQLSGRRTRPTPARYRALPTGRKVMRR
jgi:anti-sigma regulatory factor (Ser/Thr protein kinase)